MKYLILAFLISIQCASVVQCMEAYDRQSMLMRGHARGTIVKNNTGDPSFDPYHTAISNKLSLIAIEAAAGLGDNNNLQNASKSAASYIKEIEHTTVPISLPLIETQTIYLGSDVGHVTLSIHGTSFPLTGNPGLTKDYCHIALVGTFYPERKLIQENNRIFGFSIGAEPTIIEETPTIQGQPNVSYHLDKLSLIESSPKAASQIPNYDSHIDLGFNLQLKLAPISKHVYDDADNSDAESSEGEDDSLPVGLSFKTTFTKSIDFTDLNIRNNCGLFGRGVQWAYEVTNIRASIRSTSPASRSVLQASGQWLWVIDYNAGQPPTAPLTNLNNLRILTFMPYFAVSYGKVSKSSGKTFYNKSSFERFDGSPIKLNINQSPLILQNPIPLVTMKGIKSDRSARKKGKSAAQVKPHYGLFVDNHNVLQ